MSFIQRLAGISRVEQDRIISAAISLDKENSFGIVGALIWVMDEYV